MNILIIGANGQIGKQLITRLAKEEDYSVYGMVRKEEQMMTIHDLGGVPILADLEADFEFAYAYMDAIIFSAGSGAKTGPDKTRLIDQDAAIRSIDYATKHHISRFIMISSVGAGQPEKGPEALAIYLSAKGKADDSLQKSNLAYTIVRPTSLSDEPPTGKIAKVDTLDRSTITRGDVVDFVKAILPLEASYQQIYQIKNGDTSINEYLNSI